MPKTILKIISALVILVIFAGLFYWYEWRPKKIKSFCAEEARERFNETGKANLNDRLDFSKGAYENCLHRKGL